MRFQSRELVGSLPTDSTDMPPPCEKTKHRPCPDKTKLEPCLANSGIGPCVDATCGACSMTQNIKRSVAPCPEQTRNDLDLLRSQLRQTLEQAGL